VRLSGASPAADEDSGVVGRLALGVPDQVVGGQN